MEFTKEYIELCKDKRIQELKIIGKTETKFEEPIKHFNEGDWYYNSYNDWIRVETVNCTCTHKEFYWLPTGDQLDEEIIKICKEDKYFYNFGYVWDKKIYYVEILEEMGFNLKDLLFEHTNPLICKIKLLLQLLEVEK